MALICPRCHSANPEANRFCQTCGSPLSAPASGEQRPVATATLAPPGPAANGAAPTLDVAVSAQRLSTWMIVGGLAVGLLIVSAVGVLAYNLIHEGTQAGPPDPVPLPGPSTPAPPTTPTGVRIDTDNLSVVQPAGWALKTRQADDIIFTQPLKAGHLEFYSARLQQTQTPDQLIQADLAANQKVHADASFCSGPNPIVIANGARGLAAGVCWSVATSQGGSARHRQIWIEAVSADGSVEFAYDVAGTEGQIKELAQDADSAAATVSWKLAGP